MKKIILSLMICLFSFSFGENEIKVNIPLKTTDMYLYKNLEIGEYEGVYTHFLEGISNKVIYKVDDSFYNDNSNVSKESSVTVRTFEDENDEDNYYIKTPIRYTVTVLTKKDSFVKTMNDLNNLNIGYVKESQGLKEIETRFRNVKFIENSFKNREKALEALKNGLVEALIIKDWLNYYDDDKFTRVIEKINYKECIAIDKNRKDIYEKIKAQFDNFNNEEIDKIINIERTKYYKYILKDTPNYSIVKNKFKEIKVNLPGDKYMIPFYYSYKKGYKGITIKVLEEIEKVLDVPLAFTKDTGDIKPILIRNKESLKDYTFTKPYYESKVTIANRIRDGFIETISDLDNKKIIIRKDSGIKDYIESRVKNPHIIEVDTYQDGLDKLLSGKGECLAGYFGSVNGIISNNFIEGKVKIAGILNDSLSISVAINKDQPELSQLVRMIVESFDVDKTIYDDSLTKNILVAKNYKLMAKIGIPLLMFIVILIIVLIISEKNRKRAEELGYMLVKTLEMANKLNDEDTGEHTKRLGMYAEVLALDIEKFTKKEIEDIRKYATVHDIGKVTIPANILKKPGKLTEEEFNIVKEHVNSGFEIVKNLKLGKIAENIVRFHHEKWNGMGYPLGLKESEIPLEAALVGIADMYDALRQEKAYKKSLNHEETVKIIKLESGKSFSPEIVKCFIKNNKLFEKIYESNKEAVELAGEFYSAIK
ncbi:HD domain-containing phosphohydrolase [Fusobacterium sp. IOR10]|uniref:HD domain-containing phosphohydrolase n=1 Tax=Fusobacterium sp. IOR10 TaxID=2665157 RepID=UPI0013D37567|nr:HD domain-containing phosphohydrolase [Fusobacterium sp. IOR10]